MTPTDTKRTHTPGPWHIETEPFNIWDDRGLLVATCRPGNFDSPRWDEHCANARLIAAAPALLEALKRLLTHTVGATRDFGATTVAEAAISQAEGKGT